MADYPPELVRKAALDAMQDDSTLEGLGVQVFRQWPPDLFLPRIRMLRGTWQQVDLGKSSFGWIVDIPLWIIQDLFDLEADALDDVESAVIDLFATDLSITGYTVHKQYVATGDFEELGVPASLDDDDEEEFEEEETTEDSGYVLDVSQLVLHVELS